MSEFAGEVEWSPKRRAWCVQDAAGQCLTHLEHVVGHDRDPGAARLTKRMIVDGRMPAPEQALAQLRAERERARLGEPIIGMQPSPDHVRDQSSDARQCVIRLTGGLL